MTQPMDRYDAVEHFWCPQLGQPIRFAYCRKVTGGLPCPRVVTCFSPHFDVETFLAEQYSDEERDRFLGPAPGRLDRVAQALAQARDEEEEP